jgi:hypothetical protein
LPVMTVCPFTPKREITIAIVHNSFLVILYFIIYFAIYGSAKMHPGLPASVFKDIYIYLALNCTDIIPPEILSPALQRKYTE